MSETPLFTTTYR